MKSASECNVVVFQTCVPDYRVPFFEELASRFPRLRVFSGDTFFVEDVVTAARGQTWDRRVDNRFFLHRAVCWQSGVWREGLRADLLVAELNVRVLSTMVMLVLRRLLGRRTVLWGHVWGRHSFSRRITFPRITAARLADLVIAYTVTDAAVMARTLRPFCVHSASNSCVRVRDCEPAAAAGVRPSDIICVGRLNPSKRPRLLLDAFIRALPSLPLETRLVFIGEGEERKALAARVAECGLEDRVILAGHIGDIDALRDFYARALVAVSPGYVGLSAIQCMSLGVPMAISRDEQHSPEIEACIEGENCRFFDTNKISDLVDTLLAFFADANDWIARRPAISAATARKYSIEAMADGFERALRFAAPPAFHPPRTAIVWEQFGPYHLARLRAVEATLGRNHVIGVEMSRQIATYAWARDEHDAARLQVLASGTVAEKVPSIVVYKRALQLFRRLNVRTVFVPSYWPRNSLAILLAARANGSGTVMMNDSHARTAKARGALALIKQRIVRSFDAALVAGTVQREHFSQLGLDPTRIFLGYDVVDNAYFEARADAIRVRGNAVRDELGLPERYFLSIGRMELKKDLATLVRAFAILRRSDSETPSLVLVGSGSQESALVAHCLQLGLTIGFRGKPVRSRPADVLFYGFRQIDQLPFFYSLAEAFVLASVQEEWGLVVNEALASGTPCVVSSSVGCAQDLIIDGQTGFMFPAGDASSLADCLSRLAADSALRELMGRAARVHMRNWGLERFASGVAAAVAVAGDKTGTRA